jgi:hypothetical protein
MSGRYPPHRFARRGVTNGSNLHLSPGRDSRCGLAVLCESARCALEDCSSSRPPILLGSKPWFKTATRRKNAIATQKFIRLLNVIEKQVPFGKAIHTIVPRHRRQLRCSEASQCSPMARASAAMDVPFHSDIGFLAQRGRRLLRDPHKAATKARRLSICRRPASCDQPLPRRAHTKNRSPSPGPPIQTKSSPPSAPAPSVRFDPLSCSPFQVAGTRMRSSRASGSEWPRLSRGRRHNHQNDG